MNEEKEEEPTFESFDDFVASLAAEKTPVTTEEKVNEQEKIDLELKRVKDGVTYILKQLKAANEQRDFLIAFQEKYNLKQYVITVNETFDRYLVDLSVLQEDQFDNLQTLFNTKVFLPEAFNFIFSPTKDFMKHLDRKKRNDLHEILRTTKNTELSVPDDILEIDREKPLVRKEIKLIKELLNKRDLRLKKVKKVAPNLKDVTTEIESKRLLDISMLIYYYYKLTNEDVETDKSLTKVFPEIGTAHKETEKLEKELKKNHQNDRNGKTDQKTTSKKTPGKKG